MLYLFCSNLLYLLYLQLYAAGRSIAKIITIPAGMQGVRNPCPRVEHPVWVKRLLTDKFSSIKQMSIKTMFGQAAAATKAAVPRKLHAVAISPQGVSQSGET